MVKLAKYIPFINAGLQEAMTYRLDFFLYRVGDLIGAIITFFLWQAVFQSSSGSYLQGFNLQDMTFYIFLSFFVNILTTSDSSFTVGEEVKEGSIAMRLLKPVDFMATYLFSELGHKLAMISFIVLPFGICGILLVISNLIPFTLSVAGILLFILSVSLAYLTNFYFSICFGFSAFIFKNLWGANLMKRSIVAFMSGGLIPLAFFPKRIAELLNYFPFASFIYTPVMIGLGKYSSEKVFQMLLLQVFWLIFFFVLSKFIWKLTIKFLSIQGG